MPPEIYRSGCIQQYILLQRPPVRSAHQLVLIFIHLSSSRRAKASPFLASLNNAAVTRLHLSLCPYGWPHKNLSCFPIFFQSVQINIQNVSDLLAVIRHAARDSTFEYGIICHPIDMQGVFFLYFSWRIFTAACSRWPDGECVYGWHPSVRFLARRRIHDGVKTFNVGSGIQISSVIPPLFFCVCFCPNWTARSS